MSKTKKPLPFSATSYVQTGQAHRSTQVPASTSLHEALARKRPGPAPAFGDQETARLNAFVPKRLLRKLQVKAFNEELTISQVVADLLEKM